MTRGLLQRLCAFCRARAWYCAAEHRRGKVGGGRSPRTPAGQPATAGKPAAVGAKVVIVGSPNVGKSVVFNRLTGSYATVSNYPGTTVEVSRGRGRFGAGAAMPAPAHDIARLRIGAERFAVVDTPGMYSLSPLTAEEQVSRSLLVAEHPDVVIQVVDAKNLRRMLPLTLELVEAGLPLILDLNVMDEAEELGIDIDTARLEQELGIPVVATVSTTGRGIAALREAVAAYVRRCGTGAPSTPLRACPECSEGASLAYAQAPPCGVRELAPALKAAARRRTPKGRVCHIREPKGARSYRPRGVTATSVGSRAHYGADLEAAIAGIVSLLSASYGLSHRAVAVLLLQGDEEMAALVAEREPSQFPRIADIIARVQAAYGAGVRYQVTVARQRVADRIIAQTTTPPTRAPAGLRTVLSALMMRPLTGIPILALVLYVGLYGFVGRFGAGVAVHFLEGRIFDGYFNPFITRVVERVIPWPVLSSLIVGQYGVITLSLKYAVAIILPIVATFFLVFAVIEDSGYLPRLAVLVDRVFKAIGLSGRAVIPMALGFGCDTVATMVTRVLETTRERVIATLLLALAVPCSAQLGVILALLSGGHPAKPGPAALAIWAGAVGMVFLLVGFLSARLMPGESASFYMEIPPLRLPSLTNVLGKTYARMEWYLLEVLPLFALASVVIWVGQLTHLFPLAVAALQPVMRAIGLPSQAAVAFLFGFLRRDYGAAGLYDLASHHALTGVQLVVAMVTMTLFLPCLAQFLMMYRERGAKVALAMAAFILPFAFGVGYVLNALLIGLGVNL